LPGRRLQRNLPRGDDQQFDTDQLLLQAEQAAFVSGFHHLVDQRRGGGEADREALLAGRQPKPEGNMGLACAAWPKAMTFSRRSIQLQRASSSTCILLSFGIALKSKLSRLLVAGNFAALIRRSIIRRSRSINSNSTKRARNWT